MSLDCIWPVGATLGEGPHWDARADALWFTDIKRGHVHRHIPATGACDTWTTGGAPGFILSAEGDGFVIGRGHALEHFDGNAITGEIARLSMPAHNRLNDATVDPHGRIWFGSMDDGCTLPTGAVHRFDAGAIRPVGGQCAVTNGPAISNDGRRLYHVDTLAGLIWRFDIGTDGMLRDGAIFARIDPADGLPDGVTIDAEDHLWVCLWNGWSARRYAPDGTIARIVGFPCANVTKIAFGGPDLKTAYATTARQDLDEQALEAQPLAGGLFAFRVDVPGIVLPLARLAR